MPTWTQAHTHTHTRERERERERGIPTYMYTCASIHTYIHKYIHTSTAATGHFSVTWHAHTTTHSYNQYQRARQWHSQPHLGHALRGQLLLQTLTYDPSVEDAGMGAGQRQRQPQASILAQQTGPCLASATAAGGLWCGRPATKQRRILLGRRQHYHINASPTK